MNNNIYNRMLLCAAVKLSNMRFRAFLLRKEYKPTICEILVDVNEVNDYVICIQTKLKD